MKPHHDQTGIWPHVFLIDGMQKNCRVLYVSYPMHSDAQYRRGDHHMAENKQGESFLADARLTGKMLELGLALIEADERRLGISPQLVISRASRMSLPDSPTRIVSRISTNVMKALHLPIPFA